MWAAATPKLLSTIHHWRFNYWCSPVTGPLCTLIIHHQFLPVSSLFSLTPVLLTNELPVYSSVYSSVYSTNISHYILFFKISLRQNSSITEHNEQIDSWKGHKILTMNLRQCNDGSKDNQGQLAPAGAKTPHIHFISISLQNFPITIADFIIVIIIMRFICIAFFKTSLTKCFPEKNRIKKQTKRRLLKKLQIH